MLKKIILSGILCFLMLKSNAQIETSSLTSSLYFAQGHFVLAENQNLDSLDNYLSLNSDIKIFRFDIENNLFIVFTNELDGFDQTVLLSWFGSYISSTSCIQIGIQDVDERNVFPFQNCND